MEPYAQIRADIRALVRNLGVLQTRYPELGLGVTQCHALLELEARELSLGELGAILQIETSTASRNLDTLERHGLIARRPARDDARVKLHRLSARGRAKLDAVNRRGDRVVAEAFAHLTPGERDTVAAGLSLFSRALVRAQARDVAIRVAVDPALRVRADPARLGQILRNLLVNAIRYARTSITIEARDGAVSVADDGPGFPPADLPRVFDRFYRADASRSRAEGGGSGLGLAIARELVLLHGGNITAENRANGGAIVRFEVRGANEE